MARSSFSDSEVTFRKSATESLPSIRALMMLQPHFMSNLSKRTDLKYKEAVDRLRHLLQQYSPDKSVHFTPEVLVHNGHLPSERDVEEELGSQNICQWECLQNVSQKFGAPQVDKIASLLKSQDDYINHLEKENIILRKELSSFEDKIVEVIAENEKLLSANRQIVTKNIIGDVLQFSEDNSNKPIKDEQPLRRNELHGISLKSKSCPNEKQYADKDTSKSHLCERSDLEATIQANMAVNVTLQRISKERDDLLSNNMKLKMTLHEMCEREKEVESRVKKSIELAEQTDLEKQQVELHNSKLKEELEIQRERLEEYVMESDAKIAKELELCKNSCMGKLTEAQSKIEESVKEKITVEHQLNKLALEKENLSEALHQAKQYNHNLEREIEKIAADLKAEVAKESSEREQIASELNRLKTVAVRERKEQQQEKDTLKMEVDTIRHHSSRLQFELFSAKEENLCLTQAICDLQSMVSAEELAKKIGQRTVFTDIKTLEEKFQYREKQLNGNHQQTQAQQGT